MITIAAPTAQIQLLVSGTTSEDDVPSVSLPRGDFTVIIAGGDPDADPDPILPSVVRTPSSVRVSVMGGDATGTVEFIVDGSTVWTDALDETGVIVDIAVPLDSLVADTYTLTCNQTAPTDRSATADFIVANDPLERPTDLTEDTDPVDVGATRWAVQDAAPGGTTYEFPRNPSEWSPPYGPRTYTVKVSTAPDGQPLTFEGADRPYPIEFRGDILEQDFYDALVAFVQSDKRYWLIDHRQRAWQVSFESFEPTHRLGPVTSYYWSTYVMHCLVYRGPVEI